jgi:hypothetical protein
MADRSRGDSGAAATTNDARDTDDDSHRSRSAGGKLHGLAHVMVENQIALGDPPVPAIREALVRLMGEGLDRHDALHAVGSVVMGIVSDVVREKVKDAGDTTPRSAASSPS